MFRQRRSLAPAILEFSHASNRSMNQECSREMKKPLSPGIQFFGTLVDLDCHLQDLRLVLKRSEEIEFPEHDVDPECECLITDIFPDITRKSFVVSLLIALEGQFKIYCETLREATGKRLKWADLKGSALERFITYSEKVCGLEPVCDDTIREQLGGLIELRNCIVHNNSSVDGFSKRKVIEDLSSRVEGVTIRDNFIALELSACNTLAEIVLQFMEQACRSALKVFPRV